VSRARSADLEVWVQVSQPAQPQAAEHPGQGGEGSGQQPGELAEVQPLVPELYGALQMLWIEGPPLCAANTASIHQRGCPT
jgi:hypothetical protein